MKTSIISIILGLIFGSIAYSSNVDNQKVLNPSSYQGSWITMSLGALISCVLISKFSKRNASKVACLVFAGRIPSVVNSIAYDIKFTDISYNLFGNKN